MKKIRTAITLLRHTSVAFSDDNGFKLSASLSYYTIFALGPLLIIIISLAGIFFGKDAVEGQIFEELNGLVGNGAALQIQEIIKNAQHTHATMLGAIIGVVILVIAATGVFTEMQGSINFIWSVRAKPKKGWLKYLGNRLLSFSLVVGLGFLLLVSLIINAILAVLIGRLKELFPDYTVYMVYVLNSIFIFIIISGLFAVIYKVLPDAKIVWKDALIGAAFTAVLFLFGKFLIGFYLGRANLGLTYGAAASIVIILTWVYYSSMILYFGAEFTKIYALHSGEGIRPKQTAVFIIKRETKEIPSSFLDP
jgi:membrane protein